MFNTNKQINVINTEGEILSARRYNYFGQYLKLSKNHEQETKTYSISDGKNFVTTDISCELPPQHAGNTRFITSACLKL